MSEDPLYDEWIEQRRAIDLTADLTDRVMTSVEELDSQRKQFLFLRIAQWIEDKRLARWSACTAALLVGSSPFLYLAYVAQLLVF